MNPNTPKVSVIMSTYCRNHGDNTCPNILCRALDSILGQTFKDFELILIDDGSTDGTELVCREYAGRDSRIRYFRESNNSGRPAVRYNDGMARAKADLFMFMFDDDMWNPNAISDLHHAMMERPECGLIYAQADFINTQTGLVVLNFGEKWDYRKILFIGNNFLCNFSVIVPRRVINEVGGYDESPVFRRLCDWDLWVRIGACHRVVRIEKNIGRCFHSYGDSIQNTVDLPTSDLEMIHRIQLGPRCFRLKGEMMKKNLEEQNDSVIFLFSTQ